jgi:hypothetical protein
MASRMSSLISCGPDFWASDRRLQFCRRGDRAGTDIPTPAAGAADRLRLGKGGLAPPQAFLGTLAVGDIDQDPRKNGRAGHDRGDKGAAIYPDHTAILASEALLIALRVGVPAARAAIIASVAARSSSWVMSTGERLHSSASE